MSRYTDRQRAEASARLQAEQDQIDQLGRRLTRKRVARYAQIIEENGGPIDPAQPYMRPFFRKIWGK